MEENIQEKLLGNVIPYLVLYKLSKSYLFTYQYASIAMKPVRYQLKSHYNHLKISLILRHV